MLLQSRRHTLSLPVSLSWSHSTTRRYGSRVFEYLAEDQENRLHLPNPLCTVFPTVTRWVAKGGGVKTKTNTNTPSTVVWGKWERHKQRQRQKQDRDRDTILGCVKTNISHPAHTLFCEYILYITNIWSLSHTLISAAPFILWAQLQGSRSSTASASSHSTSSMRRS